MSTGAEAADQLVNMTLKSLEIAVEMSAKLGGAAVKNIAVFLYAALKNEGDSRGKATLSKLLQSEKGTTVFPVEGKDLEGFCEKVKPFRKTNYVVVRSKNGGTNYVVVRNDHAPIISRILEEMGLNRPPQERETPAAEQRESAVPVPSEEEAEQVLDGLFGDFPEGEKGEVMPPSPQPVELDLFHLNPNPARTEPEKSNLSAPTSGSKSKEEANITEPRPSVRKEIQEIKAAQKEATEKQKSPLPEHYQTNPQAKRHKKKNRNKNKGR